MAKPLNVDTIQVMPKREGSDMVVTFVCGEERFSFHLPEYVASKLLEKLQAENPQPVSPVTKLS